MFLRMLLVGALVWGGVAKRGAAQEAVYTFEWQGAGGYAMRGALAFDPHFLEGTVVREGNLSCFVIDGWHEDKQLGRWSLDMLMPETTWRLFFVPSQEAFVVEGMGIHMPQAWNMNGLGTDCGEEGFGFNIGNFAQDICVNGVLIRDSQVLPEQPFVAARNDAFVFPTGACLGPMVLGALR